MEISLRHAGSFLVVHGLSSCGEWAQESWCSGLVALWPVGSQSPIRDWTHVSCIARRILNCWTTREVPQHFFFLQLDKCRGCVTSSGAQEGTHAFTSYILRPYHVPGTERSKMAEIIPALENLPKRSKSCRIRTLSESTEGHLPRLHSWVTT